MTIPTLPPLSSWRGLVERALAEDLASGDVTTALVLPKDREGRAVIEARTDMVVCGLPVAREVFRALDPDLRLEVLVEEGAVARPGDPLVRLQGRLHSILAGERSALNFIARLAGVASHTRRFVDAVTGTRAAILDTRKTIPGWRVLDKYAAAVGGARNHRMGLHDGILLKDNHVAAAGGVGLAVQAARSGAPPHLTVLVEVESEAEARAAVDAGADALLLDNRTPDEMRRIVEVLGDQVVLEATGGVTLANVREIAETGVHRISIGALTHSAPGADVSLELLGDARA